MQKRDVADFFNVYADDFDNLYSRRPPLIKLLFNRLFRRSMQLRYKRTLAECTPIDGMSVLDIGCGPGHYALSLAQMGAGKVVGIDFAHKMIALAKGHAIELGVETQCQFVTSGFMDYQADGLFDYAVAMGFMDYVPNPQVVIEKVLSLTKRKVLFSFPSDGGFLAWQRKVRYRRKCDLFLYRQQQIVELFCNQSKARIEIENLGRDFFVIARMLDSE
jgi:2-polyprenyl-3-methyl-5-hydroxy-6-metoxy-1,4-benzoquinol methylase